jgi:hypothetical protein
MPDAGVVQWIRADFEPLRNELDERARRRWAAVESLSLGWGGLPFETFGHMPPRGDDTRGHLSSAAPTDFRNPVSRNVRSITFVSPRAALYVDRLLDPQSPIDDEEYPADSLFLKMY